MSKQRNFKAEYARRIANAEKRGLTRSQARGHAKAGEPLVKPKPATEPDPRLEAALKLLRETGNQSRAASETGVSVERFRRFLRENKLAARTGRTWAFSDYRLRDMVVISDGEIKHRHLLGFDQASLNGKYLNAVKAFLESNDADHLAPFVGKSVIDAKDKSHLLETNPNTLHRLAHAEGEAFHEIYRLNV